MCHHDQESSSSLQIVVNFTTDEVFIKGMDNQNWGESHFLKNKGIESALQPQVELKDTQPLHFNEKIGIAYD